MPRKNAVYSDSDEVFKSKVKSYFKKINPQLVDEDFLDIRVHRYSHAQPICEPNFLETLPPDNLPVTGLWAADTSYYYPEDRGISESFGYGRNLAKRAMNV